MKARMRKTPRPEWRIRFSSASGSGTSDGSNPSPWSEIFTVKLFESLLARTHGHSDLMQIVLVKTLSLAGAENSRLRFIDAFKSGIEIPVQQFFLAFCRDVHK
jgi:hypothetical protein